MGTSVKSVTEAFLKKNYNTFGSRRGNHEIMIRGIFSNMEIPNVFLLAKKFKCNFYEKIEDLLNHPEFDNCSLEERKYKGCPAHNSC